LALVATPGSATNNPYSAVASNLSKAFKGASFTCRKSTGARNAVLEKEGELFFKSYTLTMFLLLEHLLQPCISRLHIFFTAAFKEVLKSTSGVNLGSEWLKYAIRFMVETKTRDTCFGLMFKNYARTNGL
jgi:hypothetical protein